jgi:four helix bundle protein
MSQRMTPAQLRERTRQFAILVARTVRPALEQPYTKPAAAQLMRAAMSVAANYRAAGLARSRAEFISKLSIVLEEADEVVFWLELLRETDPTMERWTTLIDEAGQLVRIFAASKRTVTRHTAQQQSRHDARGRLAPDRRTISRGSR